MCRRVNSYGVSHFQEGVGPLKYMAPESLQPPHSFSYNSDAYTFGVLMWETFTESKPFGSIPPYQAAMRVLEGDRLDLNVNIPQEYRDIMSACFHADPSKRPSLTSIHDVLSKKPPL